MHSDSFEKEKKQVIHHSNLEGISRVIESESDDETTIHHVKEVYDTQEPLPREEQQKHVTMTTTIITEIKQDSYPYPCPLIVQHGEDVRGRREEGSTIDSSELLRDYISDSIESNAHLEHIQHRNFQKIEGGYLHTAEECCRSRHPTRDKGAHPNPLFIGQRSRIGGIPIPRLIGGAPPNSVICAYCNNILWEPLTCLGCAQDICKSCLDRGGNITKGSSTCLFCTEERELGDTRDRYMKDTLNPRRFICIHYPSCKEELIYENLDIHYCDYDLLPCTHPGCGREIERRVHLKHMSECKYKRGSCKLCGIRLQLSQIEEHEKNECGEGRVYCAFGCGESPYKRKEKNTHEGECKRFPVTCENCGDSIPREEYGDHERECLRECKCGFMVPPGERGAHHCITYLKQVMRGEEMESSEREGAIRILEEWRRQQEFREVEKNKWVFICGTRECIIYGFYEGYPASQVPTTLTFTCILCEGAFCRANCLSRCVECMQIERVGGHYHQEEALTCRNCCYASCEHCANLTHKYCVKHTSYCALPLCGKIIGVCCRVVCMLTGLTICPQCSVRCNNCAKTISLQMATRCHGCQGYLCKERCALQCRWECGRVFCSGCLYTCKSCKKLICGDCKRGCGSCKQGVICQGGECLLYCNQTKHLTLEDAHICKDCVFLVCPQCKVICKGCKAITHLTTLPIKGWRDLNLMTESLSLNDEVEGNVPEIFTALWHNKHVTSIFFSTLFLYTIWDHKLMITV